MKLRQVARSLFIKLFFFNEIIAFVVNYIYSHVYTVMNGIGISLDIEMQGLYSEDQL